jgi:NTE family protein
MFNGQNTAAGQRPRVGVVLASGHIKAFAAIPLFEFLDEAQITVDLLLGCSGGSIVAALRGAGYDTAQMRDVIKEFLDRRLFASIDYRAVLGFTNLPFCRFNETSSLVKPHRLQQVYRCVFNDLRLEDLHPATLLQITDIQTGEGWALDRGLVADAVYASGAVFPILPPLLIDGKWLADGVYTSPLPVMEAVKRNMDVIIAVIFEDPVHSESRKFASRSYNYIKIQARTIMRFQLALSIDLHDYEIIIIKVPFKKNIHMWDVEEIPAILETGSKAVDEKKADILAAIRSFAHKKVKPLALIAICLLQHAVCRLAPLQAPRWDIQSDTPLINHTYTAQQLIEKQDNLRFDLAGCSFRLAAFGQQKIRFQLSFFSHHFDAAETNYGKTVFVLPNWPGGSDSFAGCHRPDGYTRQLRA